LSIASVPLRLK